MLVAIVVGMAIGFLLTPKKDNFYKAQLKEQDKLYAHRLDSIHALYLHAREEASMANKETEVARLQEKQAQQLTQRVIKRYETILATPVKQHTDAEYEVVLDSLYPAIGGHN